MLPGKKIGADVALAILRRRVWWVVLPPVIGLFAALIVSAKLHNMYLAETLMRLIPQRVPESYVRSTVILPIANRLESVSREVLSQTQIEQLIGEFDLFPAERLVLPMQDVVNKARAAIDVEMVPPPRGQMPDAFHIRFTYPDPATAARVTDRLGALFVNENARDRGDLANATSEFLESQLAEARTRLEAQEQKLETFRQRHAGRLPSQLDSNNEAAHNAQMQVQAVVESAARDRDRKLMLERMYRDAEAEPVPVVQPAAPLAPRADNASPIVMTGSSQQQLATARATLASLELRLKPEHPDILRTQRQISELEKKVAAEAAAAKIQAETQTATETQPTPSSQMVTPEAALRAERLRQMRAELESLDRQIDFKENEERRLRDTITDYQRRIEAVPGLESEWAVLNRDYETQSNSYKDLLNKSEQSKVAADLEKRQIGEQFRVVDAARVPNAPISPVRIRINAAGFAIGLAFGLVVIALLELMDTTFRTPSDITDVLALPVLARVPLMESEVDRSRLRRRTMMASVAATLLFSSGAYVFWAMRLWKFVV